METTVSSHPVVWPVKSSLLKIPVGESVVHREDQHASSIEEEI